LKLSKVLKAPKSKLWFFLGVSVFFHLALIGNWYFFVKPQKNQPDIVVVKILDMATVNLSKNTSQKPEEKPVAPKDTQTSEHELVKPAQQADQASVGQPFLLPPSAHLSYVTTVNGNPNQDANITWKQDSSSYHLSVDFWMPFVGDIKFKSDGGIDAYGISPNLYQEQMGKRLRAVHFEHELKQVKMTVNNEVAPMPPGTQDRFSVIFQLASLVGGNSEVDERGVARMIPIADLRRIDEWVFVSGGDDLSPGPDGQILTTRHFRRQARSADDRRGLEVWLAKEYGWLPVKITQTEPNGTVYELNLSRRQVID
jgi:Protein of unknown function (DUF3108)